MREPTSHVARNAPLCLDHPGPLAWVDRLHAYLCRACIERAGFTAREIARYFRRAARDAHLPPGATRA
jgi:hypothetical protein